MPSENREVLLDVKNLCVDFGSRRRPFHAVSDVSFQIFRGETFGLVGESGSGKTTIGRSIIRIHPTASGEVWFQGKRISGKISRELDREVTRKIQMIFQDPMASLNERAKVDYIVSEGLYAQGARLPEEERKARVAKALSDVGLLPEFASRFPHEFSGGQRQRIGIARTLALQPKLLIADEAVSALDVSVQAQIINLLEELQKSLHLTMLFISHDLSVVRCMTDRAVVMYLGKIMEMGPTEHLFGAPAHPYTRNLIDAVPEPDPDCPPKESTMIGEPPSPMDIPGGCRFHPRCPYAKNVCRRAQPELTDLGGGHFAACHFPYACAGAPQTEAEQ